MSIHFYGASADGCFSLLENIFVNIPKLAMFVLDKIQKNIFNSITSLQ